MFKRRDASYSATSPVTPRGRPVVARYSFAMRFTSASNCDESLVGHPELLTVRPRRKRGRGLAERRSLTLGHPAPPAQRIAIDIGRLVSVFAAMCD
jgi:hypothetical protein